MNEIDIEELFNHIFSSKSVPTFKAPVIIFDSRDNNTIYPSGLLEAKDAEAYANWWMDNQ